MGRAPWPGHCGVCRGNPPVAFSKHFSAEMQIPVQRTYACGHMFFCITSEDVHTEPSGATNHEWKTNPSPWSASSSARGGKENDACVGFGGGAYVITEVQWA